MAKIKIFSFKKGNSKEISDFIQSVNILNEGFFITDGRFGIMYKDKNEVGLDKDSKINAISAELAKSQKQFILQEGLERAYTAMLEMFRNEKEKLIKERDEAEVLRAEHKKQPAIPEEMRLLIADYRNDLAETTKSFNRAGTREEKDKYLADHAEIEKNLNGVLVDSEKYQKIYEAEATKLKDRVEVADIKINQLNVKIKENDGFRENAIEDKKHAEVFIGTTTKLLEDIRNNLI